GAADPAGPPGAGGQLVPGLHQHATALPGRPRRGGAARIAVTGTGVAGAGQKIIGHHGAGSQNMAADSAATEPGVTSVTSPAAASGPSLGPPRYTAPSPPTGSARAARAVVRSQVAANPAPGEATDAAVSRQRPWFRGVSSSVTSMTRSTGRA